MVEIDYLLECFEYDHESGSLIWKSRPANHFPSSKAMTIFNKQFSGKEAGTVRRTSPYPYKSLSLTVRKVRKSLACHRLAFAMYHGYWPVNVDHFDGNALNNAISNLRPASISLNGRNKRRASHNTSGIPGVSRNGVGWVAHGAGQPSVYLGKFGHLFDAACARKSYELVNDYTSRHGEAN